MGGASLEGKMQAIFARRQLEHGDNLSQRTFLHRQTTQLRNFGAGSEVDARGDELRDVAFFSDAELNTCDIIIIGISRQWIALLMRFLFFTSFLW